MLHYIYDYRRRNDLRRIAGADHEHTLSPAFVGLLEDYGREHQLILAREWPFRGREGTMLRADGVLRANDAALGSLLTLCRGIVR